MGQTSPLLELRGNNGSSQMGNVEALGAEGTASHFYVKGKRQAG